MGDDEFDPSSHPLVVSARNLLERMRSVAAGGAAEPMQEAAFAAYGAVSSGAMGDFESSAQYREELPERLAEAETSWSRLERPLRELWAAIIACRDEGEACAPEAPVLLGREEVEELVLATLTAYPPFLAEDLPRELLRQVSLGQGLLPSEDRHIDLDVARRELEPRLEAHRGTAAQIATVCCEHLVQRSELLAVKLLQRMDLDHDGCISEDEFMRAAPYALMIEVQNVAISAGTQEMIANPEFADDFHSAVAVALGITADANDDDI